MSEHGQDVSDWWRTEIIDMAPGRINLRGTPIEELIGNVSFAQMIWLMLRADLPSEDQAKLLECALVAAVDHGPQAPSIAAARMAVTCGLGLNGALSSAVNMLDDVHGGAGEQAVELYHNIAAAAAAATVAATAEEAVAAGEKTTSSAEDRGRLLEEATSSMLDKWSSERSRYVPGFGHRFHKPEDPRAPRLLALVDEAVAKGACSGEFAAIGRCVQETLNARAGKPVPMNIDGATAVIYAELGFEPPLARGLFCLSRSVGVLAHSWEQMQQGGRIKGPTPPNYRWTYDGPNPMDD